MADIEGTAGLDISEALSSVEQLSNELETQLNTAVETFSAAFAAALSAVPPVELDADTSAIPEQVTDALANTDATVPVQADTEPAEEALRKVADDAEQLAPTIPVEADTTDAQAALEELGSSADQAGAGLEHGGEASEGFGEKVGLLAGGAELATGKVSGLKGIAEGVGIAGGAATIGVVALAGGIGELVNEGLNAESALQRFDTIVGDLGDQIQQIDVGTLSTDLDRLGIQFGSTDAEMKDTAATLFQFATNSGASGTAAADFTDKIIALAARAVALKPELGNVGDVAEALGVKIARGGRFATNFGLALTAAEINARALGDTGKATAGDLTIYEKAQAAANIAAERYGDVLGHDVAEGAKNAANEQKSLKAELKEILEAIGRPLVAPFLEAFNAALPDVKAFATVLGELAADALPLIVVALEAVTPFLEAFAHGFEFVTQPEVLAGLGLLAAGIFIVSQGLDVAVGSAIAFTEALASNPIFLVIGAVTALGAALGFFGASGSGPDEAKQAIDAFKKAVEQAGGAIDDTAKKAAAKVLADQLTDLAAAGLKFRDVQAGIQDATGQTTRVLRQFVEEGTTGVGHGFDTLAEANERFVAALAKTDPALATVAQGLIDQGEDSGTVAEKLLSLIGAYGEAQGSAQTYAQLGLGGVTTATDDATVAAEEFVTALEKQEEITQRLENDQLGLQGAILNYRQALLDQTEAQKDYNEALESGDPDKIARALLRKEQADLRVAQSTEEVGKAQHDLNVDLNDPTAVENALSHLRDLQGQYGDSAGALQPYVDVLAEAKRKHDDETNAMLENIAKLHDVYNAVDAISGLADPVKHVTITVSGDLPQLYDYLKILADLASAHPDLAQDELIAAAALAGVPNVAEGGVFTSTRGGRLINVAEAGYTEVVVSAGNTPEENLALLERGGIRIAQPQAAVYAPASAFAGVAPHPQQIDQSVSVAVDARGQPDPTRIGIAVARRLRAELVARTH